MNQVVVGVFESNSEVERAREALASAGISSSAMKVHAADASRNAAAVSDEAEEGGIAHFFRTLFGGDKPHDSTHVYGEAVRRGHCVLTVQAADADEVNRVEEILEGCGAVDIDERAAEWDEGSSNTVDTDRTSMTGAASSQNAMGTSEDRTRSGQQTTIPVVNEELRVGKREVRRGGVRVFSHMSETPVEETVQLREEHAKVERRPVNRPATEADLAAFKEGSIEIRETVEEAVVDKSARVVEEVSVGKEVTQREEKVRDSVRRSDVQVDRLDEDRTGRSGGAMANAAGGQLNADDDDDYYRAHWQSNYGNSGGSYEEYAPAYGYGSELRNSGRYSNRSWDQVEPEARRDWETRYPDSTWERFKDSVRHGWERVTGSSGGRDRGSNTMDRRPSA
jgi:uncharacterized protein (TIGR02271 family)